MTYAPLVYVGDGATTDFAVTWGKLANEDVDVFVGGSPAVYSWLSSSLIKVTPAPAPGVVLKISRSTNSDARAVIFPNATSLTADQLNKSAEQLFYLAEEANAIAAESLHLDAEDNFDAGGKRIVGIADPVNRNDAATLDFIEKRFASDAAAIAADRAAAGVSATNASTSASLSAASATSANSSKLVAGGYAADADADRKQTALDRAAVAADKATVAADKATVATDKGVVAADKAHVIAQKGLVDTAKGQVDAARAHIDTQRGLVDTARAATAADVAQTGADRVQTGLDRTAAAASAAAAAASASKVTPAIEQIAEATDALSIADTDEIVMRRPGGNILFRKAVSALKAFLDNVYARLGSAQTFTANQTFEADVALTGTVSGSVLATAANFWANATGKLLSTTGVWTAAGQVALADWSGSVTLDLSKFINANVNLVANTTLDARTGWKYGQSGVIAITTTGEFTLSLNTVVFQTDGGKGITLGAGRNLVSYYCDANGKVFLALAGKAVA